MYFPYPACQTNAESRDYERLFNCIPWEHIIHASMGCLYPLCPSIIFCYSVVVM